LDSGKFALKIVQQIFVKKGYDVMILDLKKLAFFTDYFIICSADSDVQVKAIADQIDEALSKEGINCWHKEGFKSLSWVLLDYVDVVVHIFRKDARQFYNLEKLWGDAPAKIIKDEPVEKLTAKD
jgi:ribosome-associated protein